MNKLDPYASYAPLVNRIALGAVLLAHSVYLKLYVFTLPGTAAFFASLGLPSALAYAVFAIEAAGGIALILGIGTRLAAAVATPVLLGAAWAHFPAGWLFTNAGGGWEYPLFLAAVSVSLVFSGPGAFALSNRQAAARPLVPAAGH